MIKIEITLKDEQGKQLSQLESLDLELGARTIVEIGGWQRFVNFTVISPSKSYPD